LRCALLAIDSALGASTDQESGQTILGGASEAHLDQTVSAIREAYGVVADVGALGVAYRETIGRSARITYVHKRQAGGSGEFAFVTILFEPAKPNVGYRFHNLVEADTVPAALIAGVEQGLLETKEQGLLAGFPVIDFEASLVDARYHDIDSTPHAFELAARGAFRQLAEEACPLLLEPIMKVEVVIPEDHIGDVIMDLNRRRGMIQGTAQRDGAEVIIAMVPLSHMLSYANTLRPMTHGRAQFTMCYDHYERVPRARHPDPDPDLFPPAAAMRA